MKHLWFPVLALTAAALVATAGCTQAAPPAPTQAPAKPAAAEPTKAPASAAQPAAAPAAQPTAAPAAKKVDYPQKGKSINLVVTLAAGGAADLSARVLSSMLEKELGVPIQVENKVAAAGQVALTELANSKPDGYLITMANLPSQVTMPIDPDRKASFKRQDFIQLALDTTEPVALAVRADSPWKNTKDVVAALKAKPGEYSASVSGVLASPHLGSILFMKETGTKFKPVNFDGAPPSLQAMLGGHTDLQFEFYGSLSAAVKSNQVRILSVADNKRYKFLPDVPTMEEEGFKVYMNTYRGYAVVKGTPPEIVDVLDKAISKVNHSEDFVKKLSDMGAEVRPLNSKEAMAYMDQVEPYIKAAYEMARASQK